MLIVGQVHYTQSLCSGHSDNTLCILPTLVHAILMLIVGQVHYTQSLCSGHSDNTLCTLPTLVHAILMLIVLLNSLEATTQSKSE